MNYKEEIKLDKKYKSEEIEQRCVDFWENEKIYAYDSTAKREDTYVIDTPPPTVSGSLHIGHIFSYTHTDVMARYNRMIGKSVFYPIGWDDNGLPTERRVQNYYNINCNSNVPYEEGFKAIHNPKDKSPRKDVSRKNFIEACEVLVHEDEKVFEEIFRKIGHSYDWSLKYSTISDKSTKVSQESFLDLVEKGKAKLVEAPTMWDITFQSAVAQAEVEDKESKGHFHDIVFGIEDTDKTFTIATTRPELLAACIAVVAHPEDDRYKELFGKNAIVPVFDIPVPIMPSEHAEMEKGTGIMMICTFGDSADVDWWKKSSLPIKQIVGMDGNLLDVNYGEEPFISVNKEKAQQNYARIKGLFVKKARKEMVEILREEGALVGEPKEIMHPVKFYEKGDLPIEFVSSRQWFVNLLDEKENMLEKGREIKWTPSFMHSRYENWTEGLNQDWCISRQRFFGVPFPVWYKIDESGNVNYNEPVYAKVEQLPVDPMTDVPAGYSEDMRDKPNGFTGDKDVMDTWATSALTPQIAMAHAPEGSDLSLPFDLRPQAHDIIRTWAFYTIAKAMLHEDKLPWSNANISGFILDPDRKKMSKSKGNVVTPIDLLSKHSSDAVRYWAARAKLGYDIAFEEQVMDQGRKLVMKIFNASKFVANIVGQSNVNPTTDDIYANITNPTDKAWLTKISNLVEASIKSFNNLDYYLSLEATEKGFWDFCDNYLELVKARAYNEEDKSAVSALIITIETFLKLFAPFCPFITEEVFQCRAWKKEEEKSIHNQPWPKVESYKAMIAEDYALYEALVVISSDIRKAKTEAGKNLKTPVKELVINAPTHLIEQIKQSEQDIVNVGHVNSENITYKEAEELSVEKVVVDMEEAA